MTDTIKISRELAEQICVELEHDNDRYMLGRELRKALATPPADAADMEGQAGEDGERNRAFKACPNSGCDWGAFYLGWKAKAKDLVSIRAALESQHRQQAGKLVEALRSCTRAKSAAEVGIIVDEALAAWEKIAPASTQHP